MKNILLIIILSLTTITIQAQNTVGNVLGMYTSTSYTRSVIDDDTDKLIIDEAVFDERAKIKIDEDNVYVKFGEVVEEWGLTCLRCIKEKK